MCVVCVHARAAAAAGHSGGGLLAVGAPVKDIINSVTKFLHLFIHLGVDNLLHDTPNPIVECAEKPLVEPLVGAGWRVDYKVANDSMASGFLHCNPLEDCGQVLVQVLLAL